MTAAVRGYLLSVTAAAVLLAVVQAVLPKNAFRRAAGLIGGFLMLLAVLSPLARLDYDRLARSLSRTRMELETLRTGVEVGNRKILADLIKEQCEAYILDKAGELGLEIQVEVRISGEGTYPYPTAATIRGRATAAQRERLTAILSEDLGIPAERQEWISM